MYTLEFLPIAKKDLEEIIYYISHNLKNVSAAKKHRDLFQLSFTKVKEFPYGYPVYYPLHNLKYEYHFCKVKNFLMFFVINDKEKIITIMRVLYKKRDINNILK